MPTPAPIRALQARPAPIIFAASTSIVVSPCWNAYLSCSGDRFVTLCLVMHVKRVVEIDAGQDCEDECLQEGDHDLQAGKGPHEREGCPAAEHAEADDETGKHLQHRMSGHHVGEQTHRVAD